MFREYLDFKNRRARKRNCTAQRKVWFHLFDWWIEEWKWSAQRVDGEFETVEWNIREREFITRRFNWEIKVSNNTISRTQSIS